MKYKYGMGITSPYCFQTLERRLEKQSEKGWMMDKMGVFLMRFRSCEPMKRAVQVVFDPDASEYGTDTSPYSQGLEEYIGSTGWYKACDYFKQKVYYNDDPDAVPIETDDKLKLQKIKEAMLPSNVLTFVILFFSALSLGLHGDMLLGIFGGQGGFSVSAGAICIALIPLYFLATYIRYSIWAARSEKNIEAGGGLADDKGALIIDMVFIVSALVLLVIYIISSFSRAENSDIAIQALIRFVTFFVIVYVGRNLGLAVKKRLKEGNKAGKSWIVYLVMFVVILALCILREFLMP